jgi:hypothetical protein
MQAGEWSAGDEAEAGGLAGEDRGEAAIIEEDCNLLIPAREWPASRPITIDPVGVEDGHGAAV